MGSEEIIECENMENKTRPAQDYSNCPIKPQTVDRIFEEIETSRKTQESTSKIIDELQSKFEQYSTQNAVMIELHSLRQVMMEVSESLGKYTEQFSNRIKSIEEWRKKHEKHERDFFNKYESSQKQETSEAIKVKAQVQERKYTMLFAGGLLLTAITMVFFKPELTNNYVFLTMVSGGVLSLFGSKVLNKKVTIGGNV